MNQIRELFLRLTWKQRALLAVVALSVAGGLYWFSRWSTERDFKPLLTGLAAEDAGTVTAKLKELNVQYRLKDDGATILILSAQIPEVRLQMAADGLPATGRIGFELFDKTNFGASEFTEQINYQRAIEGELQRSFLSIREVDNVRVHITPAKDSIYLESRQPAKASILVKMRRGAKLSPQNIQAMMQLAASAVPGLVANQVSVMDTDGNLLNRPKPLGDGDEPSEAVLEYRKNVEKEIQGKISATLEPLLGPEHFRTSVSADVDLSSGELSEEIYDPAKSVMVSSQKTDDGPAGVQLASGTPGTASNVPNSTARASAASTTNYQRHTENINYQTSRTIKHTKQPKGAVHKLSVSILVDHTLRWEGQKKLIDPPAPEKLKVIRDVVTAAIGMSMDRGDQLVVESFPFEATLAAEPLASPPAPQAAPAKQRFQIPEWVKTLMARKDFKKIAGIAGGVLVVFLSAGYFFWKKRSKKKKKIAAEAAAALEAAKAKEGGSAEQMQAMLAGNMADKERKDAEALAKLKTPEISTKKTDVLKQHIAEEILKNPEGMAHVVRSWLNGDYQR